MGPLELGEGLSDVSLRQERRDSSRQREVPVLRRLGQPFQHALRVREPAARDRERAAVHVIPGKRERETPRTELVPRGGEPGVRALAQPDRLVELPGPPGRVGEALQIVRRQLELVGPRVGVVGLPPRVALGGLVREVDGARHTAKVSDRRRIPAVAIHPSGCASRRDRHGGRGSRWLGSTAVRRKSSSERQRADLRRRKQGRQDSNLQSLVLEA